MGIFDIWSSEDRFTGRKSNGHQIVGNVEEGDLLLEFIARRMLIEIFALGFVVEDDTAGCKAKVRMRFDGFVNFFKILVRYIIVRVDKRYPVSGYTFKPKISGACLTAASL